MKKKHHKQHKIKATIWQDGKAHKHESVYDDFEKALEAAKILKGLVKIYNELEELIHEVSDTDGINETYA